jgi:hypothetical protein
MDDFDWSTDPVLILDGQKCIDCGGVLVAEPRERGRETIVRCRECGGLG